MRPGVVRKSNAIELMRSGGAGSLTGDATFANWRAPAASSWRAWRARSPRPISRATAIGSRPGFAGEMRYLTDRRARVRDDPRNLLPSARSVICVGKTLQHAAALFHAIRRTERGWISRYAWGDDYHDVMRRGLERLDAMLRERAARRVTNRASAWIPRRCSSDRMRAPRGWGGSARTPA